MSIGFSIDFKDSRPREYWSMQRIFADKLHLVSREIGEPTKDDRTERVPYSSVTYNFDDLCGTSYGERTLKYEYELLSFGGFRARETAERIFMEIKRALRWRGRMELHDDAFPDFIFEVRAPAVSMTHPQNGVYRITLTFQASPAMLPVQISPALIIRLHDRKYPDINGDNAVTAADAALILTAAENIAAGEPSGLTEAQEILADADRDGTITEADALLVQEYAAAVSAGDFEDNDRSWYLWLRRHFRLQEAVC